MESLVSTFSDISEMLKKVKEDLYQPFSTMFQRDPKVPSANAKGPLED